jgi:hypothetical protein
MLSTPVGLLMQGANPYHFIAFQETIEDDPVLMREQVRSLLGRHGGLVLLLLDVGGQRLPRPTHFAK